MQNNSTSKNATKLNVNDDKYMIVDSVLIKFKDFYCKEIVIPQGVVDLGKYSISSGLSAEVMYVPLSVDIFRANSVLYTSSLKKLYIENPDIYLEVGCLDGMRELKELYIGGQRVETVVTQKDGAKHSIYLERYVGDGKSYTIDKDIQVIGQNAFSNCKNLESVTFSQSVRNIDMWAFRCCSSLKEVELNDSLRNIWGCVFEKCTNIKELTIPRSVNYMGVELFAGWRRDQTIRVPSHFKKFRFFQKWRKKCRAKIIYY